MCGDFLIVKIVILFFITILLSSCNGKNDVLDAYAEYKRTSVTTTRPLITEELLPITTKQTTTQTTQEITSQAHSATTTDTTTTISDTDFVTPSATQPTSATKNTSPSTYLTPTTTIISTTEATASTSPSQPPIIIIGSPDTTLPEYDTAAPDDNSIYNYTFGKVRVTNSDVTLTEDIFSALNTYISNYPKISGIYVSNLNDNMSFSYNADKYMFAASTVKLPFLYYCMEKIQSGQYKLTDTVLYREKFRRGGTGILQYYNSGGYWSIKTLIEYTMIYSDNVAYYMLLDHFGINGYNNMLRANGFETFLNSTIRFGNVSPRMMAFYWGKIYNAYQKNPDLWKVLVNAGCMTTYSPIRDKIQGVAISNKTGWATASYHDSAIVFDNNSYVIVIMTTGEGYASDYNYICNIAGVIDNIIKSYNSRKGS